MTTTTTTATRNTAPTHTFGWFLHPEHGYMLRGFDYGDGYQTVITGLLLTDREAQEDAARWERQKSRLHVNAGSGAVCADAMQIGDHNPAFRPIGESQVPEHIRREFMQYLTTT